MRRKKQRISDIFDVLNFQDGFAVKVTLAEDVGITTTVHGIGIREYRNFLETTWNELYRKHKDVHGRIVNNVSIYNSCIDGKICVHIDLEKD